ncbi:MAG: hypothetical protein KBD12_02555 [Candidatus Pacebacteria bacterium]|nr:hypothetical protein [Candidatus Paceibacterota bacterium]
MCLSAEILSEIALKEVIKNHKEKETTPVEIKNFTKKGKKGIYVKIGRKKFIAEAKTNAEAVEKVSKLIQNHKPIIIKKKLAKMVKFVVNRLNKRA